MATHKTPGVYVEETAKFPPSIAAVETAITAFIGYTEKAERDGASLLQVATGVSSLLEYERLFGGAPAEKVTLCLNNQNKVVEAKIDHTFYLYDSLRLFFANGGGRCMIVAVGDYSSEISSDSLAQGLNAIEKLTEPTIIVMPEAVATNNHGVALYDAALAQCAHVHNRMTICDLHHHVTETDFDLAVDDFRNGIGNENLKHGAVYGPWLVTAFTREIRFGNITLQRQADATVITPESLTSDANTLALIAQIRLAEQPAVGLKKSKVTYKETSRRHATLSLQALYQALYAQFDLFKDWVDQATLALNTIPPSGAIAGVYAQVDNNRGVWKAPANISLYQAKPIVDIPDAVQDGLNIDAIAGKSVNAIRTFTGKGTLVWGARTLAGNDNEWRYISVHRFFKFIEASIRQGIQAFVFEANDANTWTKLQAMIENFLILQWRAGALQGAKPEHAFYVAIGLGKTMTALDILEGRMLIEIGMACIRPAEFTILKFSQKMAQS
ncbi:phage tail sheath family protein [Methylophilus flavus]|uniref:Phage tail sheath family protein n=1 Tax=Methylophilus flavus TaxID=640084 RepID=A0ABW3PB20_9PROT